MNHLGYVDPYNPNQPLAHRPPGYPTLIFALMYIGGESFPKLLVAAQCLLLAATATITARMAEIVAPRFGFIAFCLMLFNPNSFGTAFFVQSETLHALLVTLAAWSLMIYSAKPSIAMAAAIGLSIGTACLVRSDCQLLVVMIPPVLFVFAITTLPTHRLAKGLFYACVFLAVVSLVTMPWMIRNQMIGEGYRLTAGGSLSYYLWGGRRD